MMLIVFLNGFQSGIFRQVTAYLDHTPADVIVAQEDVTHMLGATSLLPASAGLLMGLLAALLPARYVSRLDLVIQASPQPESLFWVRWPSFTASQSHMTWPRWCGWCLTCVQTCCAWR